MRIEDDHEYWMIRICKAAVVDCFKMIISYSSERTGWIQGNNSVRRVLAGLRINTGISTIGNRN
jgi:hypothetical protein